ncbi:dipeptide ABC transporter ATP-binding protein DppD [Devosia insulae DS-56]|uniref:Dipeptide ABC transporter ATP-binding protein DppD n=1 Tax=Devosia insulae DS-56 TaxID=1116389 RepID=A0A1E5XJV8_9HYPH|nr:ABC transporter ATP-binding protein [Devosia insulae]OEO28883.1 dipeptide ABC transporter ATP-binding protein DppD [Devosia insulae DS-56]
MTAVPLLDIRGLVTEFRTETGVVRAVKGVDLTVNAGETVAVVGESGSGKSVTSLSVMRLIPKAVGGIAAGEVLFKGRDGVVRDLAQEPELAMRKVRGNEISMIFQEPMTSLNPTVKVGSQIAEAALLHQGLTQKQAWDRAVEMLALVEIPEPKRRADVFPHQMSGGMRQRVMIAMALACNPALLIADEPTTALDVTVQLQILELMRRLQREIGMGILFITHNLGVVAEIADRVAVMYGGRIVESASVTQLFDKPSHPYTRGLLASMPVVDHAARLRGEVPRLKAIPGSVVDPRRPPAGCDFNPRCGWAVERCRSEVPPVFAVNPGHGSRCFRWSELDG